MEDGRTRGVGSDGEGPSRGLQVFSGVLMSANFYRPDVVTPSRARGRAAAAMGKISRIVMPKGGRRGKTGLKGKIHRSVSRVPVNPSSCSFAAFFSSLAFCSSDSSRAVLDAPSLVKTHFP